MRGLRMEAATQLAASAPRAVVLLSGGLDSATVAAWLKARGTGIWCNARTTSVRFYARSGFRRSGEEFDMPTFAIVNLDEIVTHLSQNEVGGKCILDEDLLGRIEAYRAEYGPR